MSAFCTFLLSLGVDCAAIADVSLSRTQDLITSWLYLAAGLF
jgi:hypothetical protein